jgi:hypothetical protein
VLHASTEEPRRRRSGEESIGAMRRATGKVLAPILLGEEAVAPEEGGREVSRGGCHRDRYGGGQDISVDRG